MNTPNVAVLYICTGKYAIFWDTFYRSCEELFLPACEKHYFVFTDQHLAVEKCANVTHVHQLHLGWPDITLKRFHIFDRLRQRLASFDYVFFLNANCRVHATVAPSILPSDEQGILVVQHPGYFGLDRELLPYDRNPKSCACVGAGEGEYYVCGAVKGGTSKAFLSLIDYGRRVVDLDDKNGTRALWHDESHLNRYIIDHPHKIIHCGHCYPEGERLPFPKLIEVRDKGLHGGHNMLRGLTLDGREKLDPYPAKWVSRIGKFFTGQT